MPTIVLATQNPGKLAELRALLDGTPVEVLGLADCPGSPFPEPPETGSTFLDNATIKARAYARATGLACLADDSGLEVDALDGAPGVISSHYCTDGREVGMPRDERDRANNEKLLDDLDAVPPDRRTARFVCVMVLASPAGDILATSRGTFEGRIGLPLTVDPDGVPRGTRGFGYDPLLLVADGRTAAELTPEQKNTRSHRGQALRAILPAILELTD